MARRLSLPIILVITIGFLVGCNQSADPVTQQVPEFTDRSPTIESSRSLWGYYDIEIDPGTLEATVIPSRLAADHWNTLQWLESGPCFTCLGVSNVAVTPEGTITLDVTVTHPFGNPNLTGFDVRGIAMFDGSATFPDAWLRTPAREWGDGELVDAEGHTTLYNFLYEGAGPGGLQGYIQGNFASPDFPQATLNGYKRFISSGAENTRNAFYAGDEITVNYEIDMPDFEWRLGYAIDACWAPPVTSPVTDPMIDFGANANCWVPWKINVTPHPVDQGLTDQGGEVILEIFVFDWQGSATYDLPVLECPGLWTGTRETDWVSDDGAYSTFNITVRNELYADSDEYEYLISVRDVNADLDPYWIDSTAYKIRTFTVVEWEPELDIRDVSPDWLNWAPRDMHVVDGIAYVVSVTDGLHLIDLQDPENPFWMRKYDVDGYAYAVFTQGSFVYVADVENGLWIYDLTDPVAPVIHGPVILTDDMPTDVVVDGEYAYVCSMAGWAYCIDVDPPADAHIAGSINTGSSCSAIAKDTDILITANGSSGITTINVADPTAPALFTTHPTPDDANDVTSQWAIAAVAVGASGLHTVDLFDPSIPLDIDTEDTPGEAFGVCYGEYIYIGDDTGGLQIYDWVTETIINSVPVGWPFKVQFEDGYVIAADHYAGIQIYDVDPYDEAAHVTTLRTPSFTMDVKIDGYYAYAANGYGDLDIFDIPWPENMTFIKHVELPGAAFSLELYDEYAITVDADFGISVVDVHPPSAAHVVYSLGVMSNAQDIAVDNDTAYMTTYNNGLNILSIEEDGTLTPITIVPTPGNSVGVDVVDGYAYVADSTGGLQVIDVYPPLIASIVNNVATVTNAFDVVIDDQYAYVVDQSFGLHILDITDPLDISEVTTVFLDTPSPSRVDVGFGYAFVTSASEDLFVVDVDPPEDAFVEEVFEFNGISYGIDVFAGYAFVGGIYGGLRALDLW